MNVTDIINAAMQGSESDIAVSVPDNTPAYTTEIEKLAAALDFIGANLEDSEPTFEEKLAEYAMIEEWLKKQASSDITEEIMSGSRSIRQGEVKKPAEEIAEEIAEGPNTKKAKKSLMKVLGEQTGFSDVAGRSATNRNLRRAGTVATGLAALGGGYHLATRKKKGQKKTASLYEAAQFGKAALLEKVAEDRINPAKISAGSADAYSGMTLSVPASEHEIVRAKAQKVRNRINAEMQQYVNNTGNGYNLQGHLNVFNQ